MSKSITSFALERRIDALFARYTKPGSPGAVVAVMRAGRLQAVLPNERLSEEELIAHATGTH